MATDKIYETELDRQKAILNKFMPVSYYEHHKLFLDSDVLKMLELYRQQIEARYTSNIIGSKQIESSPDEQNYPEVTC